MRVVSISLYGFKSFAEKTIINVSSDLNAIVGPNGCGKSNVVEAVLWVLGEQSAKQLRGAKMDDVIFSGSKGRRPAQFAEVTITFDNRDHYLPIEYEEVSVSRKLFRTGESEYSINRIPVRLRDIQELFSSSGLSRQSFAIIGQGKVDEFIRQSPQERRQMIDEVSGVAKFFQKRKEAAKKLEASQLNVDRVTDLVREIEGQAEKLQTQVNAAKVWSDKKEYLDQLELKRRAAQNEKLQREFHSIDAQYNELQEEHRVLQEQFAEREKIRSVQAEAVKVLENALQRVQEKQHKAEVTKTLYEGEKKRVDGAIERVLLREKEIEVYSKSSIEKREERKKETSSTDEKLKEVESEKKALQEKITSTEKVNSSVYSDIEKLSKKLEEARLSGSELQTKVNSLSIEEKFLIKRKQEKESLFIQAKKTLQATEEQLKKLQNDDRSQRKDEIESLKKDIEEKKKKIADVTAALHTREAAVKEKEQEIIRLSSGYETVRARKEALVNMRDNFVGAHEDIRKFFQKIGVKKASSASSKETSFQFPLCLLSDFLHSELSNQPVSILSFFDSLYSTTLVVNRFEESEALFKLAEKESVRGLSCIVLEAYSSKEGTASSKKKSSSDTWLMSPKELLSSLLNRISIKSEEKGDKAQELYQSVSLKDKSLPLLHSKWFIDHLFVLRLSPQHENAMKGNTSIGRFTGEKEILLLQEEMEKQKVSLQSLRETVEASKKEVQQLIQERASLNEAMRKLDMNLVHANFQLTQIEQKKKELDILVKEKTTHAQSLEKEIQESDERLKSLLVEKNRFEKDFTEFQNRLKGIEKEIQTKKDEARSRGSELHSLRSALNTKLERIQELEKHKLRLQALEEERAVTEERMRAELSALSHEKQSLVKDREGAVRELEESLQVLQSFVKEAQSIKNELEERKKELSETLKEYQGIDKKKQSLEGKLKNTLEERSKKQAHVDIGQEEFQTFVQEYLAHSASEERDNFLKSFSEEIKEWDDSRIQSVLTSSMKEIQSLKDWLENHKSINFHAEAEFVETNERLQGLKAELHDLETTKQSIIDLIDELETKSRLEFMAAYESIRARFKENFHTLFDGGEADLILIGAESIMDAGIELKASPPGKEMRSLHLLSGGERCLTALALLFSLFQVKKAPLCLLDEVDAPLDEANVGRFNRLLQQSIGATQFILVTHNKRTMASSSKLIGVSMREKGVSCVLSVQLSQSEKERDVPKPQEASLS